MNADPALLVQVGRFLGSLPFDSNGIVVAVSGGPDSVALLHVLLASRSAPEKMPLVIAHLNHRLRGTESDADEEFVRQMHGSLHAAGIEKVDLRCASIDVAAQAESEGENLEDMARRLRYDWLAEVALETGMRWVATGHTADDQAETVLHRLLRGTGLAGLRGIAARRPLRSGVEVIRPMLAATRADVLAFLEQKGTCARQDSSNLDRRFTRNRIRHELLPYLADNYNPAISDILARLAVQAEQAGEAIESLARQLLSETERPRAGPLLIFDRQRLAVAPRHLVREMFRLVWTREGWPMGAMGFEAWERLAAVANGEVSAVDLPGPVRASGRERVVQLGPLC